MVAPARQLTSNLHIKVNGSHIPTDQMRRVSEVVVEQSLHLPSMFIIRLHDVGDDTNPGQTSYFKMIDQNVFKIGMAVEILMGREESPSSVIKGEITSVEMDVNLGHPPLITVRGYDRAHRLHRGRQIKTYQNMSDSDIVRQIASSVGLSAQVESTSPMRDWVLQNNQTNWDFVKELAARNGFEVFVDDRTLYFRKPKRGQDAAPEQKLWETLLSLRVSTSSAFQVNEVIVRGWDPDGKQAIVGHASSGDMAPQIGDSQTGAQVTSSSFGQSKVYVVNRPVANQAAADSLARAVYNELDGAFIQAEGICLGDPDIKPGKTIQISTLGTRLSGKYYVTSATHSIHADEGYTTAFVVSGRQSNSLLELVQPREAGTSSVPSVVVGIVTDNNDPEGGIGRVKVKFPWLDDSSQSWWARISSPMAGPERGFFFLPEVDDEVLVAFEHGDVTRPFVIGALWNGQDKPPKKNAEVLEGSKVKERLIKTRAGHVISLDDSQNAEKITITSKSGHVISLDDKQGSESVSIADKTGNNLIKIESSSNNLTIQVDGSVTVQAKQNVTVKASQNVDVESQAGNVTVKTNSGNVEVSTNAGNVNLKGTQVSIEAQTQLSLKGNAQVQIQGAMVQIN